MYKRIIKTTENNSYFLFGARGTGKTTLLKEKYTPDKSLYIDLLNPEMEDLYARKPAELSRQAKILSPDIKWIIIDEIQKVPKLLNIVHQLIEGGDRKFILTGSSSRKLKRGVANLLAGRAFVYTLYPFIFKELKDNFILEDVLNWGSLPGIYAFSSTEDKASFLRAYALTYVKEEIITEQIIRKLDPFRQFLKIAAQSNGKIINYSRIADDVGVDTKTIISYFSILEDTLIGYILPPFHHSIRKQQRSNPKFYLFDTGVKKALDRTLSIGLVEGTYAFGNAFEHFLILEIIRIIHYFYPDWQYYYLKTPAGAEIDLILDRPGMEYLFIEIKSKTSISRRDVSAVGKFSRDFTESKAVCLSRDKNHKMIDNVECYYWLDFIDNLIN